MTREEFKVLAKGMKAVYTQPSFLPDQDALNMWYKLLCDLTYEQANMAIMKHMLTEKFPPTIAEIRQGAYEIQEDTSMSELQAWSLVRKALRNSYYGAEEEFAKLPKECQMAVGSPANLREWGLMDKDTVNSVEQSHFIRNYRVAKSRLEVENSMPVSFVKRIETMREEKVVLSASEERLLESRNEEPRRDENESSEMSDEVKEMLDDFMERLRNG